MTVNVRIKSILVFIKLDVPIVEVIIARLMSMQVMLMNVKLFFDAHYRNRFIYLCIF